MVLSGTLTVTADLYGAARSQQVHVFVQARQGVAWRTPVTAVEDGDPTWGAPPCGHGELLGLLRDRDTDADSLIVPQVAYGDWSAGVTVAAVPTGPCQGLWYVVSESLAVDQETVINKYIKPDGPAPPGATMNFYDFNDRSGGCLDGEMAFFLHAAMNHEYRGTPPTAGSLEGHFGRLEQFFSVLPGPGLVIEDAVATSREDVLEVVNARLLFIEVALAAYTADGTWSAGGPNWGGPDALGWGRHTRFDDVSHIYRGGCPFGPDRF